MIIFTIFIAFCIILTIAVAIVKTKQDNKYINSIKIGDTFGHICFKFSNIDDPFSENYGTFGFDPNHCVTILDIKKNHKGKTWVKWCFTRSINNPNNVTWTDEINDFLRYRTRISKRIDNINTED